MKRLIVLSTLIVFVLSAVTGVLGCQEASTPVPPPPPPKPAPAPPIPAPTVQLTSVELINRDYEQKAIDYDTRALYLTYSIYKPEALPPEYQSNVIIKSATPIILEIQRNWDRLSPATQDKISQYIQPLKKRDST